MSHTDLIAPPASSPSQRSGDDLPPRAAVIAETLAADDRHTEAVMQLRERGVPGYEIEVIDPARVRPALSARTHDVVHLLAPGPGALAAASLGDALGGAVVGCHHPALLAATGSQLAGALYRACDVVLSPTTAADITLAGLGVTSARIVRWRPGVDRERFRPGRYSAGAIPLGDHPGSGPRPFHVLVVGPVGDDASAQLLVGAMRRARTTDPRLRLVLAADAPPPARLRAELSDTITALRPADPDALARIYASADLLIALARDDGFGHTVLEAQSCGLPVLAMAGSGAAELVEPGRNGCIVDADPEAIGDALRGLARRAALRDRLSTGGLMTAQQHSWERAGRALAGIWDRCRAGVRAPEVTRAA